ncbi:MAG: hypothetical protein JJ979_19455 [Roseibium sp.]|nr:hypothetical protein [Roseibium sp.]
MSPEWKVCSWFIILVAMLLGLYLIFESNDKSTLTYLSAKFALVPINPAEGVLRETQPRKRKPKDKPLIKGRP